MFSNENREQKLIIVELDRDGSRFEIRDLV